VCLLHQLVELRVVVRSGDPADLVALYDVEEREVGQRRQRDVDDLA
jgi:hypothetical protein